MNKPSIDISYTLPSIFQPLEDANTISLEFPTNSVSISQMQFSQSSYHRPALMLVFRATELPPYGLSPLSPFLFTFIHDFQTNKILFSNSNTQLNEYWTTRKQNHNSNITLTSVTHHKSSETIDMQKENFTYPYPHKKNKTYQLTTLLYSSALGRVKRFPLSLQLMCLHFPPFHPTKGLQLVFQKS